jgi:lantibiotic biosynthesis protein
VPWRPLLTGDEAKDARKVLRATLRDLELMECRAQSIDVLWSGALFYAYLAEASHDASYFEKSICWLNEALDRMQDGGWTLGFFEGICGLGWSVQHVTRLLPGSWHGQEEAVEDALAEQDRILLEMLSEGEWTMPYDLGRGLVGVGVYFVERMPATRAQVALKLVLSHLDALSEETATGLRWTTPPVHLADWQRRGAPAGIRDLGTAHGVPGVIYLLAELYASRIEPVRALSMLERAVDWLLAMAPPERGWSRFGEWEVDSGDRQDSRLGWCYGDLGIATVLQHAGARARRNDWRAESRRLAERCASRPDAASQVVDTGLCHGAFGVAHLFNRLSCATGWRRCELSARHWFQRGLEMLDRGNGSGGFFSAEWPNGQKKPQANLLQGACGSALALLAGVSGHEPRWDRYILASGRDVEP